MWPCDVTVSQSGWRVLPDSSRHRASAPREPRPGAGKLTERRILHEKRDRVAACDFIVKIHEESSLQQPPLPYSRPRARVTRGGHRHVPVPPDVVAMWGAHDHACGCQTAPPPLQLLGHPLLVSCICPPLLSRLAHFSPHMPAKTRHKRMDPNECSEERPPDRWKGPHASSATPVR